MELGVLSQGGRLRFQSPPLAPGTQFARINLKHLPKSVHFWQQQQKRPSNTGVVVRNTYVQLCSISVNRQFSWQSVLFVGARGPH